jgi:hypothetical protein
MVENVVAMFRDGVISNQTAVDILSKYFDEIEVENEMNRVSEELDKSEERSLNSLLKSPGAKAFGVEEEEEGEE